MRNIIVHAYQNDYRVLGIHSLGSWIVLRIKELQAGGEDFTQVHTDNPIVKPLKASLQIQ